MAHQIETMMFAGQTPWHKLGTEIQKGQGADLNFSLNAAGLNWDVEKTPVATLDSGTAIPGVYAIRRSTDQKVLGVVRGRYTPLQNLDAFKWFQPWLDAGEALIHTAGSLCGGQRVWVLAEITRDPMEIVKNDFIRKFLLLSHGHDGKTCVRVGFTPIRVVCANTEAMAINNKQSNLIRLNHSGRTAANLAVIRETVDMIDQSFEATAEQYRRLANQGVSQADLKKYVKLVFDINDTKPGKDEPPLKKTGKDKLLSEILSRIESGKGNDMPGVRGTLWGAYNGVTDYLNHGKSRTDDKRVESVWMGSSQRISQKALSIALNMAS